jgi:hypothetical protein
MRSGMDDPHGGRERCEPLDQGDHHDLVNERIFPMKVTVRRSSSDQAMRLLERALIAVGLLLTMLLIGVQLARATAIQF